MVRAGICPWSWGGFGVLNFPVGISWEGVMEHWEFWERLILNPAQGLHGILPHSHCDPAGNPAGNPGTPHQSPSCSSAFLGHPQPFPIPFP